MEGKRPFNPSTPKCSSDSSNNIQRSDNNGHTPAMEIIAATQMAIPSHTARSSPRDTHNVSPTRDLTTTTFLSSASRPSDSTPQNVLNQSIARDSLDRKELNPIQDNKDQTPPTETIASTQTPIPSRTTRSSPLDTRNVSTTRDRTNTFAASASQPSDSTLHNVLNQPIAPDPLDREERNRVQDNDGHTPPTENITSHVTPDMDIILESHSTGPNVKSSPSPWPKGATSASDPIRDNLHVMTTMTNHLIVGSFQNAPSDLHTCPLRPQIATTDHSFTTTFSLESALTPTTPGHSPMSTLALDARHQDPSEQPHKSSWPPTDELARRDVLAHFVPGPSIGTRLRRGQLVMLTSSDHRRPPKKGRLLWGDAVSVKPPDIIERTRSGWIIGGSLVPQSTMTSFTLPQPRRERGGQNNMQCFRGFDVAEVQRKEGEIFSRSYHEAICETWSRIGSIQAELDDLDEEKHVHSEGTSDMYLATDYRVTDRIWDSRVPLDASRTVAT